MQKTLFTTITTDRVFRYPGSKARASKYLKQLVPRDITEMISPFFGSGCFEMYLTGRGIKVYGADLFEPLVNLWNYILSDNKKLADRCHEILTTSNKDNIKEIQRNQYFHIEDKFEQAAYLWVFLCMSWNGLAFSGILDYEIIDNEVKLLKFPDKYTRFYDRLKVFHNPLISVVHRDYRDHMKQYPNHFCYLDPPYANVGNLYGNNRKYHEEFDHKELRDILLDRESQWILSYNDTKVIRELYNNKQFIVKAKWWNQVNNNHKDAKEIVIFPKNFVFQNVFGPTAP